MNTALLQSNMFTVPSDEPVTATFLFGANAQPSTGSASGCSAIRQFPVLTSHTRSVASCDAVAILFSSINAVASRHIVCPTNVIMHFPVVRSHWRAVMSFDAEMSVFPSSEKQMQKICGFVRVSHLRELEGFGG